MHRNRKKQFRPEPEFAGTRNKNLAGIPAGNEILWKLRIFYMNHEPWSVAHGGRRQVKEASHGSARTLFAVV